MNHPLSIGYALVAADIALWRFRMPANEAFRLLIRLVLFAALSAVLFSSGLSPFSQAPFPESTELHVAGAVLEVVWWLNGARLLSLSLDTLLLPKAWRRQRLFQDVFGAIVFLAAAVAALGFVLHLPIRGLVATSGALAIVLGLAIQSTLSDVFAGIVLNTTEPYEIGNWVSIDDVEGKVIEMNWRATHLLDGHGNVVIVPNAVAAKAKITNNSRPSALHGLSIVLEISPEERPRAVITALERALAGTRAIMSTPAPFARAKKTTLNSIEYEVTAYVDDMSRKVAATNELYDQCYRHLAAAGIALRPLGVTPVASLNLDAKENLLRRVEMFATLSPDDLKQLSTRLSRHEYEVNQVVLTPEAVPDKLTIVASGVLTVVLEEASGAVEVARAGPGDAFGEMGLLAGMPAQVRVSTLTPVVVYQLDKDDLTSLLKNNPDVTREMCQLLSKRQDVLGKLTTSTPVAAESDHSAFHWLLEKVRQLHSLTF